MLVLSRKIEEEIVIDSRDGKEPVVVRIVSIKGSKVGTGITAPPEVAVYRREVYDKIKNGNGCGHQQITQTIEPVSKEKQSDAGCHQPQHVEEQGGSVHRD